MKKIVLTFLSLILMLGVGLGLSNVKGEQKTKAESVSFSMEEGAAFRSYWSTGNCGIRFSGEISDASKEVYLFIAPYDYVTKIRGNNTGAIDYITAFKNAGRTYQSIIPQKVVEGGVVRLYAGLKNIQTNNLSRKFFGVFYYYENGVYHYAEMPKGEVGQARSMAYLSSAYSKDATSENDIKMTSYFVENAVKAAISMKDKSVNVEGIKYNKEERNVEISRVELSGTSLDDYLPQEKVVLRLNSGKEIEVNNALDLRINYNDSEIASYINQAGKKGEMINITQATPNNGIEYTGEIGLGETSFKLTITPYDISKAIITSQDISFTDRLTGTGTSILTDTYNTTNVTPRVTVTIPKGGRILSDKVFTNSNMSELGTLAFSYDTNGANLQDVGDASVEIKPTITATISGSKLSGNIVKSSIATKNKYNVTINYQYYDKYDTVDGSPYDNGASYIATLYYQQSFNYVQNAKSGYLTYFNNDRTNQVASNATAKVTGNYTDVIYYMPDTYTATVNYTGATSNPSSKVLAVKYGYPYSIASPMVNSFRANQTTITGIMDNINGKTHSVTYQQVHTDSWIVPYDSVGGYGNSTGMWAAKFKDVGDRRANVLTNKNSTPLNEVGFNGGANFTQSGKNYNGGFDHVVASSPFDINWSCYYLVWNDYDHLVRSETKSFYLEFEFKVYKRTSSPANNNSFLGVVIDPINCWTGDVGETADYLYLNALNLVNGGTMDNGIYSRPKNTDKEAKIGTANYLTNYKSDYAKFAMWLESNGNVTISINNIQVASYNYSYFANQECYFCIQGWNVEYSIRNALYKHSGGVTSSTGLSETQRPHIKEVTSNSKNGEYHSNTIAATNFYYETFITPTGFSLTKENCSCGSNTGCNVCNQGKVGILITSASNRNNQIFFYANLWENKERNEIGLMTSTNGSWGVTSESDQKSKILNVYDNTLNVSKRYAVWKNGASLYFIFDDTPYFITYDERFVGDCTVSLKTMDVVFDFADSRQVSTGNSDGDERSDYWEIADERGLHEVVLDGNPNDSAWSVEGRSRTVEKDETDGTGRYFKFRAYLGTSYVYVWSEFKVNTFYNTDYSTDFASTNIEIDRYNVSGSVVRTSAAGKNLNPCFAHVTFVNTGNNVIRVEAAIPYCVFMKAKATAPTSLTLRFSIGACEVSNALGWSGASYKWWSDLHYYTVTGSGINLDTAI